MINSFGELEQINYKLDKRLFFAVLTIIFLCLFIIVEALWFQDLQSDIKKSVPFTFQGKQWQCGYTPKQVDLNILEEKMNSLKAEMKDDN